MTFTTCQFMREKCNGTKEKNDFDVIAAILRVAGKGANKIEIMNQCNLNPLSLDKYLSALIDLRLLKVEQKSQVSYRTSDKGLQFLQTYHCLKWLLWGENFDFLLTRLLGRLRKQI